MSGKKRTFFPAHLSSQSAQTFEEQKNDIISDMEIDPFKRITCVFPLQMQIVVYICTTSIFIAFKDTLKCQS